MVFETRSDAEREVCEALERQLPRPPYEVLGSTEYVEHPSSGGFFEGEIDIVVFNASLGILLIEVKGGGIGYDGKRRRWHSIDHLGRKHQIDDPFKQAIRACRYYRDQLKKRNIKSRGREAIPVGYAVIFPDIVWGDKPLPAKASRELLLDASHLKKLKKVIPQVMRQFRRDYHRKLTVKEIECIRSTLLYPSADVIPTLKSYIEREQVSFVRMTEEQKRVLDLLEDTRQIAIRGYAGTGKTLLAMEKARRLYHAGLKVALLCFNRPLRDDMRKTLVTCSDRLDVHTYHSLCLDLCKRANMPFTIPKSEDEARQFWEENTPVMMLDALEKIDKRYDGVIVDEGQDFRTDWFEALKQTLVDPSEGYFYVFFDPNQSIYCDLAKPPVPIAKIVLSRNCRNTRCITKLVSEFGHTSMSFHPLAPPGEPPQFIVCRDDADEVAKVEGMVKRLVKREGLDPEDIVCLSTHSKAKSCLHAAEHLAGIAITEELLLPDGKIRFSSLHRFKGLEANVVLLCDVSSDSENCQPEHLYVATSRARHRIFIFHDESWQPPQLDI